MNVLDLALIVDLGLVYDALLLGVGVGDQLFGFVFDLGDLKCNQNLAIKFTSKTYTHNLCGIFKFDQKDIWIIDASKIRLLIRKVKIKNKLNYRVNS